MDPYSAWKGKQVLVTGGAGAIGSNLTRILAAHGTQVTILDDLSAAVEWNIPQHENVTFIRGDILDATARRQAFTSQPQIVFHLAALFANQNSIEHPERDLQVNALGTLQLLEDARRLKIERFVYASSSSIYGDVPQPVKEDAEEWSLATPYQISKRMGEDYCRLFHAQRGLPTVSARLFNSFGPGELPGQYRNVIPNFIFWAMQKKPLPITGTGDETRDFTFVEDVVEGLLRCAEYSATVGRAYNLGSGQETSIRSLAEQINQITGNTAGIRITERRAWDHRTKIVADITRARTELGYSPSTHFAIGLERTVRWFRDHWDRIQSAARF